MTRAGFRFDRFVLDPADRRLTRDGAAVALSARYFDALALLVGEAGRLVSKDRFMAEVWRGVPVTDEALTQCIRALRRELGDDAARPRFIETVPKHGYRFVAAVEGMKSDPLPVASPGAAYGGVPVVALAGTLGGGVAGAIGGLVYGFAAASGLGEGEASALIVLLLLTALLALLGAAGVALGLAAARVAPASAWRIAGGAAGGMAVGAIAKLIGMDAFVLLFGRAPGGITGAFEGAVLGGAVGLGDWLAVRAGGSSPRRAALIGGAAGGAAGMLIAALGGRLMAGSLDLLAQSFAGSRMRLDAIGALFGEAGLGPIGRIVTAGCEGALFGACMVGAMALARRRVGRGAHS